MNLIADLMAMHWQLCESPPDLWPTPAALESSGAADWIAAPVPGTVAQALHAAGRFDPTAPRDLHGSDFWYRCTLTLPRGSHHGETDNPCHDACDSYTLLCEGLATVCEVYVDGQLRHTSHSMYAPVRLRIPTSPHTFSTPSAEAAAHAFTAARVGVSTQATRTIATPTTVTVHLAFRSLHTHLARLKPPRARWKVGMVPEQKLRAVRTTLLGHMPSWCPPIHTVGPWQAVRLLPAQAVDHINLRATVTERGGTIDIRCTCPVDLGEASIICDGHSAPLQRQPLDAPTEDTQQYQYTARLHLPEVSLWWPHGMGAQPLYEVHLHSHHGSQRLGHVGFRSLRCDTGADGQGFALTVNGVPFFARGAVFTPVDMLHPGAPALLPSEQASGLAQRLQLLADMGANMLRVAGPFCYESPDFFALCDSLGLLVWQDLMLANFDYPLAEADFAHTLEQEVVALLQRTASSPALAVLCGGSEVFQQAAMLGLPPEQTQASFFTERLPALCQRWAPGAILVPNSPCGSDALSPSFTSKHPGTNGTAAQPDAATPQVTSKGSDLPFSVRSGVSHYFGVGAYERPLEDARRAAPRFVTECLAFANVPDPITLEPVGVAAVHTPQWKTGVPRDRGASWDFEDTRDHYLERVFGLHPAQLRRTDPEHYLAASRALSAHILHHTLAEWRRPGSCTRGALVFTAGDLQWGAGWGLVDVQGEPKAAYHGFREAAQPVALLLSDEGCDGLDIHLLNDTPVAHDFAVQVQVLRHGKILVASGETPLHVPAHQGVSHPAHAVLQGFLDLTYAYRFGPPGHDTVVVRATPAAPRPAATHPSAPSANPVSTLEACYFPHGPYTLRQPLGLRATLDADAGEWWLTLHTEVTARFVHIDDRHYRPADNYFHLAAGSQRRVRLTPRAAKAAAPSHPLRLPSGQVSALNGYDTAHYKGGL